MTELSASQEVASAGTGSGSTPNARPATLPGGDSGAVHGLREELWGKSRGLDTPYPLMAHLLDTAAAARVVAKTFVPVTLREAVASWAGSSPSQWDQAVAVLGGWHDIGKASCGFQNSDATACPDWARGRRDQPGAGRHDQVGACLAWDRLGDHGDRYRAAQIVGGHHGTIRPLEERWLRRVGGTGWVDDDPPVELLRQRSRLWEILDEIVGALPDIRLPTPAASVTLAVVVLADWIASSSELIERQQAHLGDHAASWDPLAHYERASELAACHLADNGLTAPAVRRVPNAAAMFDSGRAAWTDLQASLLDAFCPSAPGILFICAPTGDGKTEAGLIAAERFAQASGRPGFFFAMPTVATAEGLHERLQRYLDRLSHEGDGHSLRRVHSQSILYDSGSVPTSDNRDAVRSAANWMSGTRKALLAPFGVGTVDQVLLGALKAKHSPVRLLATACGTLIVDEAHALDPYMRKLLERAVEWLAALGAPVVILSATLPPKRVAELASAYRAGARRGTEAGAGQAGRDRVPPGDAEPPGDVGYPGWVAWTAVDGWSKAAVSARRSWMLRIETEDVPAAAALDRMAERAVAAALLGECVLVVCSTVRAACATYWALRRLDETLVPRESVEILHSRMPHGVRRDRSKRLLELVGPANRDRPRRLILVATQVVEQSFDVDFDTLITEPAPVAALLQRAGRVRRFRPPPVGEAVGTHVVWPTGQGGAPRFGSPVYPKAELMATWACLASGESTRTLEIQVPEDVPYLVTRADPEDASGFDFDESVAAEAEDATLAQLVRVDCDKAEGLKWAIPTATHDSPLVELTGALDSDDTHPGTRHRAASVLVVPAEPNGESWALAGGESLDQNPRLSPAPGLVAAAFDAAIPVSYPNDSWVSAMPRLGGGWDRTPLAGAVVLDASCERFEAGGYALRLCDETGLTVEKVS
ncbi:MAG: CRISPR-associated helicase Cas3' [bacterium]|nr:CRISPR-associated helicase Cas3' [bacterium]